VLTTIAKAAAVAAVFVLAVALAAILALRSPTARRLVAARVNDALAQSFQGKVVIQRIGKLGLEGVAGVDAEVFDPDGARVLDLRGVRVHLAPVRLLRSALSGGPLVVRIDELSIDDAEVVVVEDGAGRIGLRRAFAPRAVSTGPSRGVDLSIAEIRLGHAWVHGHAGAVPVIDADLDDLAAMLWSTPAATDLTVDRLRVRARGLGGLSPEGAIQARVSLPSDPAEDRQIHATYEGKVGDVPLTAHGALSGKDVHAVADVPGAEPEAIAAIAPGRIHLGAAVRAHAEVSGRLPVLAPSLRAQIGGGTITGEGTVTLPEGARTDLAATAHLDVEDLDASLLDAGAPRSKLSATADAAIVSRPGGGLSGSFRIESRAGEIARQVVPAASIRGELAGRSVHGTARIAERGAPTTVRFSVEPPEIEVAVETTIADLGAVPRIRGARRGRAHLAAAGRMNLDTKQISAKADVEATNVEVKDTALARAVVAIAVEGSLASPRGTADVQAEGIRAGYARGDVHAHAAIEGRRLHGEALADLGDAGRIELSAPEVTLAGAADTVAAWEGVTGEIAVAGTMDLGHVLALLPPDARPLQAAGGTLTIRGTASRASPRASPDVALAASTRGLSLVTKQARAGAAPRRSTGLDGDVDVKLAGVTGRTEVSAKLHDARGPFASIDATGTLPIAAILRHPGRLARLVRDAPIDARIVVPRRSLDALPAALGEPPVTGAVELAAEVRGTARAPKIQLVAKGTDLLPRAAAACLTRLDVETKLDYDGEKAVARITAAHGGHEILAADAAVKVSAAQALAGRAVAWEASGNVALARFPLDVAGALLSEPIAGEVSGRIGIADLHRAASLDADLDLRGVTLSRTTLPRGKVRVTMKGGALAASARLDQADGFAEARATGAIAWGEQFAPSLDLARPVDITLRAKNFRADAAKPFVQGTVSELDGRIDTDAKIHVEPGGEDGRMDGAVVLRDGVIEVPQIGERFHAVRGSAVIRPWGTVRIDGVSAEAPTGRLTASAQAVMRGLRLDRAIAKVSIRRGESIPIAVEGVPFGRAYGDVTACAQMSPDGRRLDLDVDVPSLHVDLPRATAHAVQRLEPDETIRIGVRAGGAFVPIPLGPPEAPRSPSDLAVHATVTLGDDVEVKRDPTIDIFAEGRTRIDVTDRAHVSGEIRLVRGKLELQGKQFTVDHGVVSFVGDEPSDPEIVATAFWDGPDGTRVLADYTGRVSSGRLSLRSEPELSQDQILALILFGSPNGSFGAEPPPGREESAQAKAASMAGGLVTQGLNKAISGITGADITTRVDTSSANDPQPEIAMQLSKSVSARIGYKLGVPAPGENPDRTELTIDWRFFKDWSLTAIVGDQGSTALDVLWRRRY
jgi:translocation and assembly module TamB